MNFEIKPMDQSNFKEAKIIMEKSFNSNMNKFPKDIEVSDTEGKDEGPTLDGVLGNPEATPLVFCLNGKIVGGAVLLIKEDHNNTLDILFVDPGNLDKGIGYRAWQEIEKEYPDTVTWNTITPTCLMRNVCFYVNKCGFHIVKVEKADHDVGMFVFQKTIK
ncbi:MAG: GNAT family N-acetyltransferase [Negativicutes bacterium]